MVTALESKLEDLELWLVTSGKFSNNQSILAQIEDHKVGVIIYSTCNFEGVKFLLILAQQIVLQVCVCVCAL